MEQYINKSDVVAMIKHHIKEEPHSYFCKCLLSEIDTLEVKEVDLDEEIEEVKHNYKVEDNRHTSICSADIEWLAQHFFELGIKAQKGEEVMAQEQKQLLLKGLEWIDMETRECHCYNCELFDSKNNVCKCIDLCKSPKSTYKGFYKK